MGHLQVSRSGEVAVVALRRGKVNALNPAVVRELGGRLEELARDATVGGLVLTGSGKFFSFGFDVPEFMSFSKEAFTEFLREFTRLYTKLYVLPKPVVAALNGHAVAGGCMLALACDHRVMVPGKAKIALNEVTFGATVFAGCVEMLRARVGQRNAETILLEGAMLDAERARGLGLVDELAGEEELAGAAESRVRRLARHGGAAFANTKVLLRAPIVERMRSAEPESIRRFVEIWYSKSTREQLAGIRIRD